MEKVSILMSIYRPNPDYLRQQLRSLNAQTYRNLELLVWNDCPEEEMDRELFRECVDRFPVFFFDEKQNLGYAEAFARLSALAAGEYLSYCDQDDIWEPEKIARCMAAIRKEQAVAAVCDRALVDGDGKIICPSVRRAGQAANLTWKTGDEITPRAAFFSYCTGMTLIARREEVKKVLPLTPGLPHDQQLIFFLSAAGKVACVEEPLVRHRRYGTNASGTLSGIRNKQDYYDTRCRPVQQMLARFEEMYPEYPRLAEMQACAEARVRGSVTGIWKYRDLLPDLYRYEIALALCPEFVFQKLKDRVAGK